MTVLHKIVHVVSRHTILSTVFRHGTTITTTKRNRRLAARAFLGIALLLASCGGGSSGGSAPHSVTYRTLNYSGSAAGSSTFLTGIRGIENSKAVFISGIYTPSGGAMNGLLYQGPLKGGGTWNLLNFPSSPGATVTSTAIYGPDDTSSSQVTLVGNYTTSQQGSAPLGLLYQGPPDGSGTWQRITPPGAAVTIAHSNMGGLVVGNYDTMSVVLTGKAFIYDIAENTYDQLVKPGSASITAYGIWHNGGASYTITGGYSDGITEFGYLVDWDSSTRTASNWTSYRDPLGPTTLLTHFEGLTGDGKGGYNLASDQVAVEGGPVLDAAFANVPRTSSGNFGSATWQPISYPSSTLTSANSVFENAIIGIYQLGSSVSNGYVARGF